MFTHCKVDAVNVQKNSSKPTCFEGVVSMETDWSKEFSSILLSGESSLNSTTSGSSSSSPGQTKQLSMACYIRCL